MILRPLTEGAVSGSGAVTCSTRIFGGALISANGEDAVTVTVRKTWPTGPAIFSITTKQPGPVFAPIEGAEDLCYSITGTDGKAQLFEWVE